MTAPADIEALAVLLEAATAAEFRANSSLSRDFDGNPGPAVVYAASLRAALGSAS